MPTPCRNCASRETKTAEIPFHEYAKAEHQSGALAGAGESLIQQQEPEVVVPDQENAVEVAADSAFEANASVDQPKAPVVGDATSGVIVVQDVVEAAISNIQVGLESMPSLVAMPDAPPSSAHIPQDVSGMSESASFFANLAIGAQGDLVSSTGAVAARSMNLQQLEAGHESHRLGMSAESIAVKQTLLEQISSMSKQVLGAESQSKESLQLSRSPELASTSLVDKLRGQLNQKPIQSLLLSANENTSSLNHGKNQLDPKQISTKVIQQNAGLRQFGEDHSFSPAQARAEQVDMQLQHQRMMKVSNAPLSEPLRAANVSAVGDAVQGSAHAPLSSPIFLGEALDSPLVARGSVLLNGGSTTTSVATDASNGLIQDRSELNQMGTRLVRGMSAMLNQNGGMMRMRLEPDALGEVRIQMNLNRGSVSVSFEASSAEARGLIQQHLQTLEAALKAQGMTVEQLTVKGGQSTAGQSSESQQGQYGDEAGEREEHGQDRGDHNSEKRAGEDRFAPLLDLLNLESIAVEEKEHLSTEAM